MAGNANYTTDLLTSTLEKFLSKQAADAIFDDIPLFDTLYKRSKITRRGGIKLLEPIMYAKNSQGGSYSGYDLLDTSPVEGTTNAEFEWKQYSKPITISGYEELVNSGETAMLDMLENKWNQARMSIRDDLSEDMYANGTGNSGKDIVGLDLMVDSAGTYGNIVRSTNAWWSSQETAVGGSLRLDGATGMRTMYNDCALGHGKRQPNLILCTQSVGEDYEALMDPYMRYTIAGEAGAVFKSDNLLFRKAPVMWDADCTSGVMYFLNTEFIKLVIHEGRDFTSRPFQTPPNQDAKVAHILVMLALAANNCRHLGKLTGIT